MEDRQIVAGGAVLGLAGVGLMLVPGSAGIPGLVATLLVVGVVGVGLVVALGYVTNATEQSVTLPTPERRPRYRHPGESLGETLDSVDLVGHRAVDKGVAAVDDSPLPRERLYTELHELAVDVLTRTTGCTRAEAASRLAEGTWTDDPGAAAFFVEGVTTEVSWRHRVPGVSSPELPLIRRGQHVIAALTERADGESVDPDSRGTTPEPDSEYWATESVPVTRSTGRIQQVVVAVLLVAGAGVLSGVAGLVLVATVGITVAAAVRLSSPDVTLTVSRELGDEQPAPGEEVRVTVTVRNDGDRTLPDLRLLDGVPAGLEVVDESPRFATALRPGKTATFSYTVEAVDGTHAFEPAIAVASDFVGASEQVRAVQAADEPTELSCGFDPESGSDDLLASQVTVQSGLLEADASGTGVEFDTVREYRRGDPPGRIDWRHRAKTGDLSTVEYREPHHPRVVLVVDDRALAYVAPASDGVPAPRHSAVAATTVGVELLETAVPVGVATIASDYWLPPGCGDRHQRALRADLAGTEAVPWTPPADSTAVADAVATLDARLAPDTQVLVFSGLADDASVDLCQRLDAAGHAVTVISPDCTAADTVDGAYGRLERRSRRAELQRGGISVRDWHPSDEEVSARER